MDSNSIAKSNRLITMVELAATLFVVGTTTRRVLRDVRYYKKLSRHKETSLTRGKSLIWCDGRFHLPPPER